jgi:hypothetical protein
VSSASSADTVAAFAVERESLIRVSLAVLAVIMWKTLSALQLIGEMLLEDVDPRKVDLEHREGWRKKLRSIKRF